MCSTQLQSISLMVAVANKMGRWQKYAKCVLKLHSNASLKEAFLSFCLRNSLNPIYCLRFFFSPLLCLCNFKNALQGGNR